MEPIIAPIKTGDTDAIVANLQDALLALLEQKKILQPPGTTGLPTPDELQKLTEGLQHERVQSMFGKTTWQLVVYFQLQQGLGDNLRGVVEEKTAAKLNELLKSIGAFDSPDLTSFVVRGQVRLADGTPLAGALVRAHDKDLRHKEPLGKPEPVTADTEGRFELTYTAEQFSRVEKGNADLLVEARRNKETDWIAAPIRFNAQPVEIVDITLDGVYRGPSEFRRLVDEITPLLDGLTMAQLTENSDFQDITFLSNETGVDRQLVAWLAVSALRAEEEDLLQHEEYYGLFRQNLPTNLDALLEQQTDALRGALEISARNNLIRPMLEQDLKEFVARVLQLKAGRALYPSGPNEPASLGDLLTVAVDVGKHELIAKIFLERGGATETFWKALKDDSSVQPADVAAVQQTLALGTFTNNHLPLVRELYRVGKDNTVFAELRGFAQWDETQWQAVLQRPQEVDNSKPIGFPPGEESIESYARTLNQSIENAFPMAVISNRLERDNSNESPFKEAKSDLLVFFSNNPEFSFTDTPSDLYLSDNASEKLREIEKPDILRAQLKSMQRVFNVTPHFPEMRALLADDMHSAASMVNVGERWFTEKYAEPLGGASHAREVYNKAEHVHATALNVYMKHAAAFNSPTPYVISGAVAGRPAASSFMVARSALPVAADLSTLFGSLGLCDCRHCQSLYSPAAYLVDILKFLNDGPTKDGVSPLQVLQSRCFDIALIELTCENTNTQLPYVDLVNEILEFQVAPRIFEILEAYSSNLPGELDADRISSSVRAAFVKEGYALSDQASVRVDTDAANPASNGWIILDSGWAFILRPRGSDEGFRMLVIACPQTSWTSDELRANPEHIHAQAYAVLQNAVYPWNLPLNLPLEEVRAYLGNLGMQRHEVMETLFLGAVSDAVSDKDIALEYLGLAKEEADIITGVTTGGPVGTPSPAGAWNFWGLSDAGNDIVDRSDGAAPHAQGEWAVVLQRVSIFLQQSGLSYKELLELLGAYFINPTASLSSPGGRLLGIVSTDAADPTTCNLSKLEIQVVDNAIGTDGCANEGIACYVFDSPTSGTTSLYRLFNPTSGDHFYTTSAPERDNAIVTGGYASDGIACYVFEPQTAGTTPLFRLFNPTNGNHFYTTSVPERDNAITANGYTSEGIACYVFEPQTAGTAPLYRLLNPINGDHFYTTSVPERDNATLGKKEKLKTVWNKIHRFVRLWRKLGWTMRDLDKAITAQPKYGNGEIDINAFLIKLSHIQRLYVETSLPVVNLLAWWADIDTGTYVDHLADGEPTVASLYAQLFSNKTVSGQVLDDNPAAFSGALSEKAAAIAAALQISVEDFTLLQAAIPNDGVLKLANLSLLYRHATFAKALKLPIRSYLTTLELVNSTPFAITANTIQFIKHIDKIRASGFTIDDLDYLLRNKFSSMSNIAAADDVIETVLDAMRDDLRKVSVENTWVEAGVDDNATTSDPNGELTRKKLALLNWDTALIEKAIAVLNDTCTYETMLTTLASSIVFQESLKSRISYDSTEKKLRFTGTMTAAERALLVASPNTDASFVTAIGALFKGPKVFVERYMARFSAPVFSVKVTNANLKLLLANFRFPDALKSKIYYDTVAETSRFVGVMTEAERSVLSKLSSDNDYLTTVQALFDAPDDSTNAPLDVDIFLTSAGAANDASILFDNPNDKPQVRFLLVLKKLLPYLQTTLSEIVVKQRLGEYLKLDATSIDGLLKKWLKPQAIDPTHPDRMAMADFLNPVFAESSPNVQSSKDTFPLQFDSFLLLNKIAILILKFKITPLQLQWLFEPKLNAGWLDINALRLGSTATTNSLYQGWERLVDLFQLRDALPRGEALLKDIFTTATAPGAQSDPAQLDKVLELLSKGTQWELSSLRSLLGSNGFNFAISKFAGEAAILRLAVAFAMLKRLGASADQCLSWAKLPPTSDDARDLKSLVRAKYDDAQWLELAKALRDPLRERQRSALVAYLVQDLSLRDADDLHDRFLIDVEMSPCMMTTRIKQAISSVQLFIQRCLMNLEPHVSLTPKEAKEYAQWRKWSGVWEANRKVLFYPENWIEPELRDDKSPFYKDLENELLQSDVTMDTAEDAFLHYLEKLDQVARLEIVGMYHQQEPGDIALQREAVDILHVFGRTYAIPHHYFYRRLEDKIWSAWEKVDLDIEGDHLIPVEWNRRLHLFWPIFTEKADQPTKAQRVSNDDPTKYWEIKFAWSEYKNKRWSPKRLSTQFLSLPKHAASEINQEPGDYTFKTRVQAGPFGEVLAFECYGTFVDRTTKPLVQPPDGTPKAFLASASANQLIEFDFTLGSEGSSEDSQFAVHGIGSQFDVLIPGSIQATSNTNQGSKTVPVPRRTVKMDYYLESANFFVKKITPNEEWGLVNNTFQLIKIRYRVELIKLSPAVSHSPLAQMPVYFAMQAVGRFSFDDCLGDMRVSPVTKAIPPMDPKPLEPLFGTRFESMMLVEDEDRNRGNALGVGRLLQQTPGIFRALGQHDRYTATYLSVPFFYQDDLRTYFVWQPTNKRLFSSFYHPRIGNFIKSLNRFGISGLLTLTNQRLITGDHFYTTDIAERDNAIVQYGYQSEGIGCYVYASQVSGTTPLYRLLSTRTGDHFYTTDIVERNTAITLDGYKDEDIAGYVYEYYVSGAIPLYRLLHSQVGDHFYTTDNVERDTAIALGYKSEKIACYVFNFLVSGATPLYRLINPQIVFEQKYKPGILVGNPYPIEDVNFEYGGAYSLYNWELFFHTPFLIAVQLSKNQRFEEAQKWFHYIFDPTATDSPDRPGDPGPERFWRVKPFYDEAVQTVQTLEGLIKDAGEMVEQITAWQANPFKPHVIARLRVVAYMKAVVMRYIDNLTAWGDQLFRRDTIESINEATQLYILAGQILGRRPESIPARAKAKIQTFRTLDDVETLDALSNAAVEIESFLAPSVAPTSATGNQSAPPLTMQYFCITANDKLLGYWDTVSDRLFKIRHCMNIEGVERSLPIFEPPIDPALLVRAAAAGVDIASALNDINAALPHYRFSVMVQKASELCNDVKALGGAFLSALEKRDAEALALLRSSHEVELLKVIREIKEQQTKEANNTLQGLMKYQDVVTTRQQYYLSRPFMNPFEEGHIALATASLIPMGVQLGTEVISAVSHLVPESKVGFFTTIGMTYGGSNIASAAQAFGSASGITASMLNTGASLSSTLGGYQRRQDNWTHQADLATKELKQVEKQIVASEIRLAISEHELQNHDQQIENAKEVDEYMRYQKFTNQELYSWMVGQLSGIYFQSYQLAYDVAKRAERAYRYELGLKDSNFIQFGYWDSLKKGLLSGERLHHDLKRMDVAYLDLNKREYEITKHISLMTIDPISLIKLKATNECFVSLPEVLFDIDYPGHYMRRIKSVSITIPCVTGPYAGVNCTLTQLNSSIRHANTLLGSQQQYFRHGDDTRFSDSFGSIQSIVTSSGQNDSGLFEANLRDERYLPFEGQGAISTWRIQLPKKFESFDYATISDVVLQVRYTARDGGGLLKQKAMDTLTDAANAAVQSAEQQGLARSFSLRHEFPSDWNRFLNPPVGLPGDQAMKVSIEKTRFPFLFQSKTITISGIKLFVKVKPEFAVTYDEYTLKVSLQPGTTASANVLTLTPWSGLLRAKEEPTGALGDWTLAAWRDTGDGVHKRIDPQVIEDIVAVCAYTIAGP